MRKNRSTSAVSKMSLSHICEAFNEKIQVDFMFTDIRNRNYCVLHIGDTGTSYSETGIVSKRSLNNIISALEACWILKHGSPCRLLADSEYIKKPILSFLESHGILHAERPVRRYSKIGIVERKHRTVKTILERIQSDNSASSDAVLFARATFFPNMFSGYSIVSSFELVRGYSRAIFGGTKKFLSKDLLKKYKDRRCTRVLQRNLK